MRERRERSELSGRISAVVNTYNAAGQLAKALESLRRFDEIVVCDMESTDNTREIAESYGAKVVIFPKNGYNICEPARDFAIHSASNPWVIVVDADEQVPESLADYLYAHTEKPDCAEALSIPFKSMFMGEFVEGNTEYHTRFFLKDKAYWPPIIHARVQIEGKTERVPDRDGLRIVHFDDPTLSQRIIKMNRYTDNEVEKRASRRYSAFSMLIRPWLFFLKSYLLKGNFRNGRRGIFKAYMELLYQVLQLGKHYERYGK